MNIQRLSITLASIKTDIERAITTASFAGNRYDSGQKAKEALIRSSRLILQIHEVAKEGLDEVLRSRQFPYRIHPPLGSSSPELHVAGFIKKKRQDIVILIGNTQVHRENIDEGPLQGTEDTLGRKASETAIVIGVRSQLSSVDKNFDTLMERAFAETLNLRLRLPTLVMGEIYLLPIFEYDDIAMQNNRVAFKRSPIGLQKFIRTFIGISGRMPSATEDLYKYERSALILTDFRQNPPEIYSNPAQLIQVGVNSDIANMYPKLSPEGFAADIINAHLQRHQLS